MNHQEFLLSLQSRGLRAWQANFVVSFLETDSSAFHLLAAPPGMGKSYTSISIAAELASRGARRILVLPPASLCDEWRERLGNAQSVLPVVRVTGQNFREIEAARPIGESPLNANGIYVISQDLLKNSAVFDGVSTVVWDFVVVDEAHRFLARKRPVLQNRMAAANVTVRPLAIMEHLVVNDCVRRLLLLSATPLPTLEPWLHPSADNAVLLPSPLVTTSWFGVLTDWDGTAVGRPRVPLDVHSYTRSANEVTCLLQFLDAMKALKAASGGNDLFIQLLTQRASSSVFALEQRLRRVAHALRTTLERGGDLSMEVSAAQAGLLTLQGDVESTPPDSRVEWTDKVGGLEIINQCLNVLEMISSDEKLDVFKRLVRSIVDSEPNGIARVCVLSAYGDTVSYLHTAADDVGLPLFKVTLANSFAERQATVKQFLDLGGLIVGSDEALSEGLSMPQVTHVIHYDLPPNPLVLEQRRGRFDRIGRTDPLRMHVLRDESGVFPFESHLIDQTAVDQDFDAEQIEKLGAS